MIHFIMALLAPPLTYVATALIPPKYWGSEPGWIAMAGILCLALGVVRGIRLRQRGLLLFLIPVALTHLLFILASIVGNRLPEPAATGVLLTFLLLELLIPAYLIYTGRGARFAAVALSVFSITYAVLGALLAAMSFSNTWL